MNEYKGKIRLWHCYQGEYPISQRFGDHFYNKEGKCVYVEMGMNGHNGVDFALPIGTKLMAVSDGRVTKVISERKGYGNHMRLHCSQGDIKFEVLYAHCSKFLVKQGENIFKGQFIAESGNTGLSSGPHLHFGLRILDEQSNVINRNNGYFGSIDPLELFDLSESNTPANLDEIKEKKLNVKIIKWAKEMGIISDEEVIQLKLNNNITIEQFLIFLKRYHNSSKK